jgi:protein-L-isoaspartate(D-aspartate) O-methyltransferase
MRRFIQGVSITVICLLCLLFDFSPLYAADDYTTAREEMIELIEEDTRKTAGYIGKTALDTRVLKAMARVPRHLFVPERYRDEAYENTPLPIGHGQTISQPYIVALMTNLLDLLPHHRVLEIGTGSGYQAAILAELSAEVYSIEIIEPLAIRASAVLKGQHYKNVQTRTGDGYFGWPEAAPFDAIVVTAAADHIPPPLVSQLKAGGRMVIPVGSRFMIQQLVLLKKDAEGKVSLRQILPVRFVPLTGDHRD